MYEVILPRRVRKAMNRFPEGDYERVLAAIRALENDPRPSSARKMRGTGEEAWRMRVGDYRIEEPHPEHSAGMEEGHDGLVTVLAVGHRQGVYG